MKTTNIKYLILIFLSTLSCRQGFEDNIIIDDIIPGPEVLVETTIYGRVINNSNEPIANAKVFIGNKSIFTDAQGVYVLNDVFCREKMAVIDVFHTKYMPTHSIINPFANDTLSCYIHMNKANDLASFQGANPPAILNFGALKLDLSLTQFLNINEEVYNDLVNIRGFVQDEIIEYIYNEHRIALFQEEDVLLQSYGQFEVQFLDYRKVYQISLSDSITAQWEIFPNLLNNAPAEIFIWKYNRSKERWVEVGKAQKLNAEYIFKIVEDGQYCLATYNKMKYFSGTIQNNQDNPIPALDIRFEYNKTQNTQLLKTSNQGKYLVYLPIEERIEMKFQTQCYVEIQTIDLGFIEEDLKWLTPYKIDDSEYSIGLSGTLLDCNNEPLSKGYILVNADRWLAQVALADMNGQYHEIYETCKNESVQLKGFNLEDGSSGIAISYRSKRNIQKSIVSSCTNEWKSKLIMDNGNEKYIYDNCRLTSKVQGTQLLSYYQFAAVDELQGNLNHVFQKRNNAQIGEFWISQTGNGNSSKFIIEEFRSDPFVQLIQDDNQDWWVEFEVNNVVLKNKDTGELFENSRLYYFARRDD